MSWTVADVMSKDVVVVLPDEDFKSCVKLMNLHEVSALPVVDRDGKALGVLSESDLLAKERERGARRPMLGIHWGEDDGSGRTAGDMMTAPAICIGPTASIPEAARLMYREAVKRLPVVDAEGVVIGVVSRADLLKTFIRSDESIRRDVIDDVIKKALFIDPKTVHVDVTNGLVRLSGELESKSLCNVLVRMAQRVEGTVGVDSTLRYRLDDSHIHAENAPQALQLSADQR
jgi:CBS domain-containing protein